MTTIDPLFVTAGFSVATALIGYVVKSAIDSVRRDLRDLKNADHNRELELKSLQGQLNTLSTVLGMLNTTLERGSSPSQSGRVSFVNDEDIQEIKPPRLPK